MPVAALEDEDLVERALTAIALRLDGKAAAATVARRKRAVFYNVLDTAATGKRRLLARNPLASMRWKPPGVGDKVDRRAVINPRQAREFLIALSYIGGRDRDRGRRLVAMFACMYYGALRQPKRSTCTSPIVSCPTPAGGACICRRQHPRWASAIPTAVNCMISRA